MLIDWPAGDIQVHVGRPLRLLGLHTISNESVRQSSLSWAWSLNQGAATASSELILKAAHLIAKENWQWWTGNTLEAPTGSVAGVIYRCQWASGVSSSPPLFFFKDPCFIGNTGSGIGSGSVSGISHWSSSDFQNSNCRTLNTQYFEDSF